MLDEIISGNPECDCTVHGARPVQRVAMMLKFPPNLAIKMQSGTGVGCAHNALPITAHT